ncbi:MAG: hypothetical protein H7Z21_16825 [Hymenobacter sp.]|nr:hypothetical protein [Hymenobacter sp.]
MNTLEKTFQVISALLIIVAAGLRLGHMIGPVPGHSLLVLGLVLNLLPFVSQNAWLRRENAALRQQLRGTAES